MFVKTVLMALGGFLVLVLVAACSPGYSGSSSKANPAPTPVTQGGGITAAGASPGPVTEIRIEENEFSLSPSAITVPSGKPVRFVVTNEGKFQHNLTVKLESAKIEKTLFPSNLNPGETKNTEFTFEKAGEWKFYCPVDGHEERGMKGTIKVEASQPPQPY